MKHEIFLPLPFHGFYKLLLTRPSKRYGCECARGSTHKNRRSVCARQYSGLRTKDAHLILFPAVCSASIFKRFFVYDPIDFVLECFADMLCACLLVPYFLDGPFFKFA